MSRRAVGAAVAVAVGLVGAGACSSDEDEPDPAALAGAWDVTLVIGSIDADPDADPGVLPTDATFRERWVFEACDGTGCTLRRPDGGILLGDLDGVRIELGAGVADDEGDGGGRRLGGEARASLPPPIEDAGPCDGAATEQWQVSIDLDVEDSVLSGSVLRRPDSMRTEVDGTTCFGAGLSLGLSGTPSAGGGVDDDG